MDVEAVAKGLNEHHLDVLDRLAKHFPLKLASRHQDQIRRHLRLAGLIAHCGKPKCWQISEAGLAVRNQLLKEGRDNGS